MTSIVKMQVFAASSVPVAEKVPLGGGGLAGAEVVGEDRQNFSMSRMRVLLSSKVFGTFHLAPFTSGLAVGGNAHEDRYLERAR
jgi:hypothetical protein